MHVKAHKAQKNTGVISNVVDLCVMAVIFQMTIAIPLFFKFLESHRNSLRTDIPKRFVLQSYSAWLVPCYSLFYLHLAAMVIKKTYWQMKSKNVEETAKF